MEIAISCQLFNHPLTTSDIKEYLTVRYIKRIVFLIGDLSTIGTKAIKIVLQIIKRTYHEIPARTYTRY